MAGPTRAPAGVLSKSVTRIQRRLGFTKSYNFWLWFVFDGALFFFCLARLKFIDYNNVFCNPELRMGSAAPGECYWYNKLAVNGIAIRVHLASVLPAGILAFLQFIPAIRQRHMILHRVFGYISVLLTLIANGSAIAVANHAFGGDMVTRSFIGALAIITTTALGLAMYNIKVLQIEQHRAWMLRSWAYLASIVTLRLVQISMVLVSTAIGSSAQQYRVMPCEQLLDINKGDVNQTYTIYPMCDPAASAEYRPDGMAIVRANFITSSEYVDGTTVAASLQVSFGAAGVLALILHVVGVELYLWLTPKEAERLRKVSYKKQLDAGFANPGSVGTVRERFGDAEPWVTPAERKSAAAVGAGIAEAVDKKAAATGVLVYI